uniref:hypothetical protein n=1 Tax=Pseudonocardia sp. CA-138482 TaxID=3240023 RepID=UPI003F49A83F
MSRRRRRPATNIQPHPLPPGLDVRQIIREELTKALALPPGAVATPASQSYLAALAQSNPRGSASAALARDTTPVAFGPGTPLYPAPLDPVLPSGRAAPRRWEYPPSWNLDTTTTRAVPFSVLRDAADQVSIMRTCIEVRKSTMCGLDWGFGIDSTRATRLAQASGETSHSVTSALREKYADDIDRLHTFWLKPDRINGWTFGEWLSALMEEQLVLDAVAVYPHLTMGGDLHSLELLDATTIKPLLDYRGATPQPPQAAYQQILYGFPRGEQAASPSDAVDAEFVSAVYGRVAGDATDTDVLIYKVRRRRTNSPYGFSNVEQSLADADMWLKRVDWLRQEYAAGVTPEMIVQVDASMTPEQLRQYEAVFNDELSGRTSERHRARFLPAGFDSIFPPGLDEKFSPELDLHLIRLVCADFDVLPSSLGFVPHAGLGGQGHQQGEQDAEGRRGTKPTAEWITDLINEISAQWLGMPDEVSFQFHGLDAEDEQKEATLLQGYVGGGLRTLNEGRDQLNLPRYQFPEADVPFLATPTGPAWLDTGPQPALPSGQPTPPAPTSAGPPVVQDESVQPVAGAEPTGKQAPRVPRQRQAEAEQKAFLTFAAKRAASGTWRDFAFNLHSPSVAEAANRLGAAGDVDALKALFALQGDA